MDLQDQRSQARFSFVKDKGGVNTMFSGPIFPIFFYISNLIDHFSDVTPPGLLDYICEVDGQTMVEYDRATMRSRYGGGGECLSEYTEVAGIITQ